MTRRTFWYAPTLTIKDEPLVTSLVRYRQDEDRWQVVDPGDGNLVSSLTENGTHMPILDLDFPHHFEQSTTDGHTHLFIDVEMSRFKLSVLILALWFTGVIEMGHAVWTLRRGASFVRIPGLVKTEQESVKPTYGWFRKLKSMRSSWTLANEEISIADVYGLSGYDTVDLTYGASSPKMYCPFGFMHSDEGYEKSFRMYGESNTAHCFACGKTWKPVSLYADMKGITIYQDAADALLEEFNVARENTEDRWDSLVAARDDFAFNAADLAEALRLYCIRISPNWEEAQFDKSVSTVFNRCLALLGSIKTPDDVVEWLTRTKKIMESVLLKA